MTIALGIFGVAFAAFCVWLTVRIVNRRERWAKWTLALAIGMPVLYVLGMGPVVWLVGHRLLSESAAETIYWPLNQSPAWIRDSMEQYAELWQ